MVPRVYPIGVLEIIRVAIEMGRRLYQGENQGGKKNTH